MSAYDIIEGYSTGRPLTGQLVDPTTAQKKKRAVMLGQFMQSAAPAADVAAQAQAQRRRTQAMAEALSGDAMRPTVSGSLLEGFARGGEAFLNARNARNQLQTEAEKVAKAEAEQKRQREAMAAAVRAGQDQTVAPDQRQNSMIAAMLAEPSLATNALTMQSGVIGSQVDQVNKIAASKATSENQAIADLLTKGYTRGDDGAFAVAQGGPAAVQQSQFDRELAARVASDQAENDYRYSALSRQPAAQTKGELRQEKRLSDEADAAQAARTQALKVMENAKRWLGLSEKFETGMGRDLLVGKSAAGQEMDAITKELVTQLPRLPGAASERDAINLERSTLQITKSPAANKNIANAQIAAAQNAIDYSDFVEATIERGGSLRDVQSLSSAYLQEVPIFGEGGVVNPTRPRFGAWLQAKQKQAEIDALKGGR